MFLASRLVAVLLLIGAAWLVGCGQVAQKAVEQATGVQVDQKGDSITIKGKDGEQFTAGQVPEVLRGFSVPSNLKPTGGFSASAGGDTTSTGTWAGRGSVQSAVDFYKKTLPEQGWKEEQSITLPTGTQLVYGKGDSKVMLTIAAQGDDVNVTVILGKSSQPSGGASSGSSSGASASPTPRPTAASTPVPPSATIAPPVSGDSSALAPELRDVPVPSGFTLERDSAQRVVVGGVFAGATASWIGRTSVKDVGAFYRQQMAPKGWTENAFIELPDGITALYSNTKDATLNLGLEIERDDNQTRISVVLTK